MVTAVRIANVMGEDYKSSSYRGAKDSTILNAFRYYGLIYKIRLELPEWDTIVKNIEGSYPITLTGFKTGTSDYHAVLITAYVKYPASTTTYVKIWDPYEEDVELSEYSKESVSFKSNGIIYHGDKVFSYYYE